MRDDGDGKENPFLSGSIEQTCVYFVHSFWYIIIIIVVVILHARSAEGGMVMNPFLCLYTVKGGRDDAGNLSISLSSAGRQELEHQYELAEER